MHENAILQQIDVPIERLLADFRWQSIDFADALQWRINHRFHQNSKSQATDAHLTSCIRFFTGR